MNEGLRKTPELHLVRVQHTVRLGDEPIVNLNVYGHLLEAKVSIGDILAAPRDEGMDMFSILIIPVCIYD